MRYGIQAFSPYVLWEFRLNIASQGSAVYETIARIVAECSSMINETELAMWISRYGTFHARLCRCSRTCTRNAFLLLHRYLFHGKTGDAW